MKDLHAENENRGMMKSDYGDNKVDKSNELNESMTISEQSRDEYEQTVHTLGGASE